MKQGLWIVPVLCLCLCACSNQQIHSERVFSNAQILYQDKKNNANKKTASTQMPSYFLDLEYTKGQTKLSAFQVKKMEAMLQKLDYSDEYHIYASFGAGDSKNQVADLADILKRATDLKSRLDNRVKKVSVAYLKNQKPDSVYIRVLG